MTLEDRIIAFVKLGEFLRNLDPEEFDLLAQKVENNNNWFTPASTRLALEGISHYLQKSRLKSWTGKYGLDKEREKKSIGLILAGNIPAVGFHDYLSILISGHKLFAKLSSADKILLPWLSEKLKQYHADFRQSIFFEDMLMGKDAYIATGSDNSSRYFNYYFGKYPSIIRKNRTSVAVLNGEETVEDYQTLANDIFQYFGLGCRNVSKLYVKDKSEIITFLDAINGYHFVISHHKYLNNYDYNKSIYLVNKEHYYDNGFMLVKESTELVSPISVVYFEIYQDENDLSAKIKANSSKIQCIVSKAAWFPGSLPFGKAQLPELDDYADKLDTIEFLKSL